MSKEELKLYLIEEAEYSIDEVNAMSNYELVDNWLAWQGIVDWTEEILGVVCAAFDINIDY